MLKRAFWLAWLTTTSTGKFWRGGNHNSHHGPHGGDLPQGEHPDGEAPEVPTDYCGDCRDVFELVTGTRTLPQDKSQRLYILSLKENRISGRMRMMVLVPTQCMTSDSLTKPMIHYSMMHLLSTGLIKFANEIDHPVPARIFQH